MENGSNGEDTRAITEVWRGYGAAAQTEIVPCIEVLSMALGQSFGLFLTVDYRVFCFGSEKNETPLGLGEHVRHAASPTELPFFADHEVAEVSCGPSHSAVVCRDGTIFAWGQNEWGQCGTGTQDFASPVEVPVELVVRRHEHVCPTRDFALVSLKIRFVQVSCGGRQTLAVAADGDVWMWGADNDTRVTVPRRVLLPAGRRALSVACGSRHCLAVLVRSEANINCRKDSRTACSNCDVIDQAVMKRHGAVVLEPHRCPLGLPIVDEDVAQSGGSSTSSPPRLVRSLSNDKLTKDEENAASNGHILSHSPSDTGNAIPSEADFFQDGDLVSDGARRTSDGDSLADDDVICKSTPIHGEARVILERERFGSFDFISLDATRHDSSDDAETLDSTRDKSCTLPNQTPDNWLRSNGIAGRVSAAKKYLSQQLTATAAIDGGAKKCHSTLPSPHARNAVEKFHFVSKYDWDAEERHSMGLIDLERSFDGASIGDGQDGTGSCSDALSSNNSAQSLDVDSSGAVTLRRKRSSILRPAAVGSSCECLGKSVVSLTRSALLTATQRPITNAEEIDAGWQTEVWSWGRGKRGQLGLGDALDRGQPTRIKSLSDVGVVKVVAGHTHSVALLASGLAFAWGSNSHGQLARSKGSSDDLTCSPVRVTLPDRSLVCDVAAGHRHSVFLVSGGDGEQEIFVCGRQEGPLERSENALTSVLIRHQVVTAGCRVRQVFAGGPFAGCVLDPSCGGHPAFLYELNETEMKFFSALNSLTVAALQPLLDDQVLVTGCGPTVRQLFETYVEIATNAAQNANHLRYFIRRPDRNGSLPLFHDVECQFALFERYCHCFCDVLAVDGFAVAVKVASRVFLAASTVLRELRPEKSATTKGVKTVSAETLQHLMEEPIRHMGQYSKIFENLSGHRHRPGTREQEISDRWRRMVAEVASGKADAEKTRAFWDSCPAKTVESIRQPGRRVLRDSKTNPVTLLGAGRFSNHLFVLCDDAFVHSQYSGTTAHDLALTWVDVTVSTGDESDRSSFRLTFPEETLTLVCETALGKTEWVSALNDAINSRLRANRASRNDRTRAPRDKTLRPTSSTRRFPPLRRSSNYVFLKHVTHRDACYRGGWFCGQMHGQGELTFPDNRRYVGSFKQNERDGYGTYTVGAAGDTTVHAGRWRGGKLNGLGSIRYANGDSYEGFFKDGLRHGHGVLRHGSFVSAGSIYVGRWAYDHRHGYGVMDSVDTGEKYMGEWRDDQRHGRGAVVTLDGVYYECNFVLGRASGLGLVYDDGSWFRGEVGHEGCLAGKGTLTLSCGDAIEGTFAGNWSDGVKVTGTLTRSTVARQSSTDITYPSAYATFCVDADRKWEDIFEHCWELLGIEERRPDDTQRAWEAVAVFLTSWKKHVKPTSKGSMQSGEDLGLLERIPPRDPGPLTRSKYREIRTYLQCAFDTPHHPLGRLMIGLVDVYRATYVGIGAHPCLLHHAVQEVHSFVRRIFEVVRVLFPSLPAEEMDIEVEGEEDENNCGYEDGQTVTAQSLLLPILLPKIYPPLFTLYAYACEREDVLYWETLLKWNRQPDLSLMAFLGVDEKFWLAVGADTGGDAKRASVSVVRDAHYRSAINALQQMSTTFSPLEKLQIIQRVFEEINVEVSRGGLNDGAGHVWTMDDLFPVFQYVVIRAAIRHLGSEIRLVDDLMERRLQNGELGIMFTMLKACYFQVKNEKSLVI